MPKYAEVSWYVNIGHCKSIHIYRNRNTVYRASACMNQYCPDGRSIRSAGKTSFDLVVFGSDLPAVISSGCTIIQLDGLSQTVLFWSAGYGQNSTNICNPHSKLT